MKWGILLLWSIMWLIPSAKAQRAQVTFIVRDDSARVVTNATIRMSTYLRTKPGMYFGETENQDVFRATDTNGVVTISIDCRIPEVTYAISVRGQYYDELRRMNIDGVAYYRDGSHKFIFDKSDAGRWQPWNPTIELLLRRILNPVPMYVKVVRMDVTPFPAMDEPLAYDLEKGDWLSPYGNGQTADFIFRVHCDWSGENSPYGEQYYNATLELTFSNEDDGIIEFRDSQPEQEGSIFRLPRYAPEAGYTNRWSAERFTNKDGSTLATISQRKDLNYFFRVRTKRDETGKIISANYGKIRGPLDFGFRGKRNGLGMTYYFNPNANDRNMEFDPSQNLFTDLPMTDQVHEP